MAKVKVIIKVYTVALSTQWFATARRLDTNAEVASASGPDKGTAIARCRAKLGSNYEVVGVAD